MPTTDPSQIQNPSQIPPAGAQRVGLSTQGLVDVYYGTEPGDTDAQPAAKELVGTALDTSELSNADYIYTQVSRLYGNASLPDFQNTAGETVKSLVFVSGSTQGGYGAFHIGDGSTQAAFDRIVVDSLTVSGNYSPGSGLAAAVAPARLKVSRIFAAFKGAGELLSVVHADDPRLDKANEKDITEARDLALQNIQSLKAALATNNPRTKPLTKPLRMSPGSAMSKATKLEHLHHNLIHANQEVVGMVRAITGATSARQYLSTALFAAELVESFQTLTRKGNPGLTDGEAVSRVVAFKLTPEISLVPGFSSDVTQAWWKNQHPDFVTDNSQGDQSEDGNGAGVMFLLFLNDYLGIALDEILASMPAADGAPLGDTYVQLLARYPALKQSVGADGKAAFNKMVSLLQQNAQGQGGMLNLPANGNPFPGLPGAKSAGLFKQSDTPALTSVAQDVQGALGLETQLEQQLAAVKSTLLQIKGDLSGTQPTPDAIQKKEEEERAAVAAFGYKPQLDPAVVTRYEQAAASFRAPEFDQSLRQQFWPHVYNELPNTGNNTNRLQVITGTIQTPQAVQVSGTVAKITPEGDGDVHIYFHPDDPNFPANTDSAEPPLEVEIIYVKHATQPDAKPAEAGYTNPFADASSITPGTRIQVSGPLIYDRAHGRVDANGNVQYGLEIHPVAGLSLMNDPPQTPTPAPAPAPAPAQPKQPSSVGNLAADLASAQGQLATLDQTVSDLKALIQKLQSEAPSS